MAMVSGLFESCFDIDLSPNTDSDIAQALKLAPLPGCKGTLLFADQNNQPIQLLICANIRKTATARLFPEEETASKRADLRSIVRKIYYTRCFNDLRNSLVHYHTLKELFPGDFKKILKLARQTFVKIDTGSAWPGFQTTENPIASGTEKVFGPFPTRKAANDFIQILQTAFNLCQMPNLISNPEKAKSCTYLQMGNCPAPCVGNITKQQYLQQINNASDAAAGNLDQQIKKLNDNMLTASEKMQFEAAQHIKKQIDKLQQLSKNTYKWTSDLTRLRILHIDRSAKLPTGKRKKQQLYTAFLITLNSITELGDYSIDALDCIPEILSKETTHTANNKNIKDTLAIICYNLFRSNPQGIWLNCSTTPPDSVQIKEALAQRFKIAIELKETPNPT